jgi:hypothetical protein
VLAPGDQRHAADRGWRRAPPPSRPAASAGGRARSRRSRRSGSRRPRAADEPIAGRPRLITRPHRPPQPTQHVEHLHRAAGHPARDHLPGDLVKHRHGARVRVNVQPDPTHTVWHGRRPPCVVATEGPILDPSNSAQCAGRRPTAFNNRRTTRPEGLKLREVRSVLGARHLQGFSRQRQRRIGRVGGAFRLARCCDCDHQTNRAHDESHERGHIGIEWARREQLATCRPSTKSDATRAGISPRGEDLVGSRSPSPKARVTLSTRPDGFVEPLAKRQLRRRGRAGPRRPAKPGSHRSSWMTRRRRPWRTATVSRRRENRRSRLRTTHRPTREGRPARCAR